MSMTDNGDQGILQGVEPAQPRKAADWGGQQNPAQQVSQPVQLSDGQQQPVPTGRIFTEEEVETIRRQEKDKLYGRINEMDAELKEVRKERNEAAKQRKAQEDADAAAQRAKEEEQMELRDLLTKKDQEWNQRFQTIEQERERDRATFERERQLMEVEQYRLQRLAQEEPFIMPELLDLVRGNSIPEVDQSIEDMKRRTESALGNMQGVPSQQQPMLVPRGASPTTPSHFGPMEQQQSYEQLSPEDIRTMDIETYKKYRESLLASASQSYRGRRSGG